MTYEKKKDYIAFFVGIGSAIPISIVGRFYLGEFLVLLVYLLMPESHRLCKKDSWIRLFNRMASIWLFSQLVTDFIRQTPIVDTIKGSASIIMLMLLIPFAFWALHDKPKRWLIFYVGYVISTQINYYFSFSLTEFGQNEVWKIYSYVPVAALAAAYCYYRGRKKISYVILLGFGLWTLFHESRNIFLTNSLSVCILYYIDSNKAAGIYDKVYGFQSRIVKLFISLAIGLIIIDYTYESLASQGILGEYAYEKYIKQKSQSGGLASGRTEAIMAIDLISRSPIIGYGSYAKDRTNYVYNYYLNHNIDFNPSMFYREEDSIENMLPRHSRIFGLWMWHGIGAGIFWLFILLTIGRVFKGGYMLYEPDLLCLCVVIVCQELWDTLFSPMSIRLPLLFLVTYMILIKRHFENARLNNQS